MTDSGDFAGAGRTMSDPYIAPAVGARHALVNVGYAYVGSLKPKSTTKKKKS
jgi:hypothetical protein